MLVTTKEANSQQENFRQEIKRLNILSEEQIDLLASAILNDQIAVAINFANPDKIAKLYWRGEFQGIQWLLRQPVANEPLNKINEPNFNWNYCQGLVYQTPGTVTFWIYFPTLSTGVFEKMTPINLLPHTRQTEPAYTSPSQTTFQEQLFLKQTVQVLSFFKRELDSVLSLDQIFKVYQHLEEGEECVEINILSPTDFAEILANYMGFSLTTLIGDLCKPKEEDELLDFNWKEVQVVLHRITSGKSRLYVSRPDDLLSLSSEEEQLLYEWNLYKTGQPSQSK